MKSELNYKDKNVNAVRAIIKFFTILVFCKAKKRI